MASSIRRFFWWKTRATAAKDTAYAMECCTPAETFAFLLTPTSSPMTEAPKLFAAIAHGADIAIGSRWLRTELQTERQPLYRQAFGRIFNLALRIILGLSFADTQCGFKAFRRGAAQQIFPLQKIERWGFDPEILFLARRAGLKTEEVPVIWAHSEGTRLNPLRDGLRMFVEVLRIRWYSISGEYEGSPVPSPGKL
jgi:dolichyl-phosphate beta-glucosyltransferase